MKDTFILKATNKAEYLAIRVYLQAKQFTIVNHGDIDFCPIYFVYEYGDFGICTIDCKPAHLMPRTFEFVTFPQLLHFEKDVQQLIKSKKQIRFSDIKLGEYFCFPTSSDLMRKTEKGVAAISRGEFGFSSFGFDDNPVVKRVENVSVEHSFDIKG